WCLAFGDPNDANVSPNEFLALAEHFPDRQATIFRTSGDHSERLPVQLAPELIQGKFSPDGTTLAVLRQPRDKDRREIELLSLTAPRLIPAIVHLPVEPGYLQWDRQGRRILVSSTYSRGTGGRLLTVDIRGSRVHALRHRWHGFVPAGWAPAGDEVYLFAEGAF